MAISKIVYKSSPSATPVTWMDVTAKTVTASSMLNGTTALKNDGTDITGNIQSQAAQTIHPSTSDQSIAANQYLTGAQTIKGVLLTNLLAGNIKKDVVVKVGDSSDDDCVTSVTGTYEGSGGGTDYLDLLLKNTITSYSTDVTTIPRYLFYYITSLKSITMPNVTTIQERAFEESGLEGVFRHDISITLQQGALSGTKITTAVFPNGVSFGSTWTMNNCTSLTKFDGVLKTKVYQNTWNGNSSLNVIVLRDTTVRGLDSINAFTNTPFASNGVGGTLYVPNSLISTYQSAYNWSTILGYSNNSIVAIEGSQYENYYADGTPIS